MPPRIKILSDQVANAIAAGEIIERPFSVVKELIENALDAGADIISVELKNAGHKFIQVRDNGTGMTQDDALLAFERHATSKVESLSDISNISTMGFRGEALPSIAAVSKTELITRTQDDMAGTLLKIDGGIMKKIAETGCAPGTTITVKNIFFNLPARRKHLTSTSNEMTHMVNLISAFILAWPGIQFRLINNNREILNSAGVTRLEDAIRFIYGPEVATNVFPVKFSCLLNQNGDMSFPFKIEGFISNLKISRATMRDVCLFVNKRPVRSKIVINALKEAYHTILPQKRCPVAILNLKIDPRGVDVNVHPNKQEVRFLDEKGIGDALIAAVNNAVEKEGLIIDINEISGDILSDDLKLPGESIEDTPKIAKDLSQIKTENTLQIPAQTKIFSTEKTSTLTDSTGDEFADVMDPVDSIQNQTYDSKNPFDEMMKNTTTQKDNSVSIHPRINEAIVKGQIFDTYIVAENKNELLLLDQHIVHERILYEKYMDKYFGSDFASQGLLFPLIIELSATDKQIMHKNMYILQKLGFTIEPFGGNNFLIKTVPVVLGKIEEKEAIYEILDTLMTTLYVKKIDELKESLIIKTSCHNAIKANQKLTIQNMQQLIHMLARTKNPYTCPHGRPIIVSMNEKEIKRRFKRS